MNIVKFFVLWPEVLARFKTERGFLLEKLQSAIDADAQNEKLLRKIRRYMPLLLAMTSLDPTLMLTISVDSARRREERRIRKLEKLRQEEQRNGNGNGQYGGTHISHSPRDIDPLIGRPRGSGNGSSNGTHTRHRHHHSHRDHDAMPFGEPYVLNHLCLSHCMI
jgi:hypothetical protein